MLKFKINFGIMAMFIAVMFLSACGNSASSDAAATDNTEAEAEHGHEHGDGHTHEDGTTHSHEGEAEADAKPGKEITSVYVCPMHCDGSGSAEPGKCPACEMDYVFNAPYHSAYICPMHCDGSGSDAEGKCPKCEMDYVKNEHAGHSHG